MQKDAGGVNKLVLRLPIQVVIVLFLHFSLENCQFNMGMCCLKLKYLKRNESNGAVKTMKFHISFMCSNVFISQKVFMTERCKRSENTHLV